MALKTGPFQSSSCLLKRAGSTLRACERLPSRFRASRLGADLCTSSLLGALRVGPPLSPAHTWEEEKSQEQTGAPRLLGQEAMERDRTEDSCMRLVSGGLAT